MCCVCYVWCVAQGAPRLDNKMAKFAVRFDIAEEYVVEVEAEDEGEAVRIVEADPQYYKKLAGVGGWDLVSGTIAAPIVD